VTGRGSRIQVVDVRQKTWFAEQQRAWQGVLSVPRVLDWVQVTYRRHSERPSLRRRHAPFSSATESQTPATYAEPVLFCYALIIGIHPGPTAGQERRPPGTWRGGFDVYMIDWGVPCGC